MARILRPSLSAQVLLVDGLDHHPQANLPDQLAPQIIKTTSPNDDLLRLLRFVTIYFSSKKVARCRDQLRRLIWLRQMRLKSRFECPLAIHFASERGDRDGRQTIRGDFQLSANPAYQFIAVDPRQADVAD